MLGSLAFSGIRSGGVFFSGFVGLGFGSGGFFGVVLVWAVFDFSEVVESSRFSWVLRAFWGLYRVRGSVFLERVVDVRVSIFRFESRVRVFLGRGGWCVR